MKARNRHPVRGGSVLIKPTARAEQVDQVTGHVVDQMRQEGAERRAAHGPVVYEEHVGAGAHAPVGHLTGADVDEAVRRPSEQVGCFGGSHGWPVDVWNAFTTAYGSIESVMMLLRKTL